MEAQLSKAFDLVSLPNNAAIKEGENLLNHLKTNSQYPLALLQYINNSGVQDVGKLRAAIELKLWCQYYKNLEEFERPYYAGSIENIKQRILETYLTFPLKISKTLRPGIVALADVLFPNKWGNLISNLLSYAGQVPSSITAVLKIIQSVSHKYTYLSRSDPLYEQIIIMCDSVHDFLLDLTATMLQRVQQNPSNADDVIILEILMKIFYNLNYQDLHPKYEDNISNWMTILKEIMNIQNINEHVFKCKGAALEAILLYASKYKEDVEASIQGFCSQIWQLCSGASEDPEYDDIVFNCLKFFKSLMLWPDMKPFFIEHMNKLFQNLIIPNIGITKTLIGLFEDEVQLYIDYYFRNTEIQTRRAAALELLRVICRHYSAFQPFLEQQLQNYQSVTGNVQAQCTILSLTIDGSSKGFRDVDGCTQLFVREELINYTYQSIVKKTLFQIYQWLGNNSGKNIESHYNVIHIATIIRFLFYFRIYFPKEELNSILQFLTVIKTGNKSLSKVIYLAINGFLIMKHGDFIYFKNMVYFFRGEALKPCSVDILKLIYEGTTKQQALQQSLTKMLYNLVKGLGSFNDQFFNYQIEIIKEMLKRTKVYDFTSVQYLFETIGELAYRLILSHSANKAILQKQVMDYFMQALKTKSDLLNFCLQNLAIFLQLQPTTNTEYKSIYDSLLMPQNWREQNQSLMSSYIQFLIAFISKFKTRLIEDKGAVEIILSKIIEIDHIELFYRFLEAIMNNISLQQFYMSGYLNLAVQGGRATSNTIQGRKSCLLFFCKMTVYYDTAQALRLINQCCATYYDQLLEASTDILKTISKREDRKYLFASICKAISLNYFQNLDLLGTVMNCLIINTVQRFNFRNISQQVSEAEAKQKKESTYKKLQVFKEFQNQPKQLQINEQTQILNTFKYVNNSFPDIVNFIDQKNRERLIRLNEKYTNVQH